METDSGRPAGTGTFYYGWVVVGVTFLTLLAASGIRSTAGVLIVPLEREFGWTRATVSIAVSVNLLLYGLIGPFAGALFEAIGVRRVMTGALVLLATGVTLTTRMTHPWQMVLLWGVLVGCGSGSIALTLSATVVNRWFTRGRGTVMGFLTASTATGQLVFLPLLASLTLTRGWRVAALVVGGVALTAIPLVLAFMRDRPSDVGLLPLGEDEGPPVQTLAPTGRNPARLALDGLKVGVRSTDFWLLAGSFFICGASTNGLIGTHLIPACIDHGIPEVKAASLLAMMGVLDLAGTTLSGWLSDRYNSRYLLCWYYGLRGCALLGLPTALAGHSWGLSAFAVFYGLDWIATVPPTVRLTADAFGREKVGVMFGWIFAAHQIGASLATLGAGTVRTVLGDYLPAFLAAGTLCLFAAGLVLRISRVSAPAAAPR